MRHSILMRSSVLFRIFPSTESSQSVWAESLGYLRICLQLRNFHMAEAQQGTCLRFPETEPAVARGHIFPAVSFLALLYGGQVACFSLFRNVPHFRVV